MARSVCVGVLVALVLALTAGSAVCQYDRELVLFSGDLSKVSAASWGAGTADLTDEETYLDRDVLEIETNGLHEGGRLDLKTPEALSAFLTNPEKGFLVIVVKVHQEAQQQQVQPGGGEMLVPGAGGPMDPGMMPPGAGPMDPGMMPPGPGRAWTGMAPPAPGACRWTQ